MIISNVDPGEGVGEGGGGRGDCLQTGEVGRRKRGRGVWNNYLAEVSGEYKLGL